MKTLSSTWRFCLSMMTYYKFQKARKLIHDTIIYFSSVLALSFPCNIFFNERVLTLRILHFTKLPLVMKLINPAPNRSHHMKLITIFHE